MNDDKHLPDESESDNENNVVPTKRAKSTSGRKPRSDKKEGGGKQKRAKSQSKIKKPTREMGSDDDVEFVREVNPSQENDRIMCMRIRLNADKLLFRLIHPDGVHI
jgi:hypothetical protein